MAAEPVRTHRLSLRAKLVRLGTRLFIKPASRGRSLAASRKTFRFMARLAPPPPRGTKTTHIDAGGVPAESIVRPGALAGRHVLYLHGGGYCLGSPANYRHFSWRIADAARAPVLAIDYRLAPEHPFPAALEDARQSLSLAARPWRARDRRHGRVRRRRPDARAAHEAA